MTLREHQERIFQLKKARELLDGQFADAIASGVKDGHAVFNLLQSPPAFMMDLDL